MTAITSRDAAVILDFFRRNGFEPAPLAQQQPGTMFWRLRMIESETEPPGPEKPEAVTPDAVTPQIACEPWPRGEPRC